VTVTEMYELTVKLVNEIRHFVKQAL